MIGCCNMKKIVHITIKDLRQEFRTKQMLNPMFVFSLLSLFIFSVAFSPVLASDIINLLSPVILCTIFIFAGSIAMTRSFACELENGCLDGLRMCPVSRSSIYTAKALTNLIIMTIVELFTIPIFIVLFNYSISNIVGLFTIIFLGTIGFVCVATLLSALTVNTRTRELLLPVLLMPLILPALIPAVMATTEILSGAGFSEIGPMIRILVTYDIIFYLIAQLVFEYVIQD